MEVINEYGAIEDITCGDGQYRVVQVAPREQFVGKGYKTIKEIEDVCNKQYAEGYRLHTFSQSMSGFNGSTGSWIICSLVFEKIS